MTKLINNKHSEFILSTNLKTDVTILGVASGKVRDSKQDAWRSAYFVFYTLGNDQTKRKAEVNETLYTALHLVFDTILHIESPDLYDDGKTANDNDLFLEASDRE